MTWKQLDFDLTSLYNQTHFTLDEVYFKNNVTVPVDNWELTVSAGGSSRGTMTFDADGRQVKALQFDCLIDGYLVLHGNGLSLLSSGRYSITKGTYRIVITVNGANPRNVNGVQVFYTVKLYKLVDDLTDGFSICEGDQYDLASAYYSKQDYGLAISNTDAIGEPILETYYVDIPSGEQIDLSTALTGEPVFKNREISIDVGLTKPNDKTWSKFISSFRNKWHGKRVCINFDNDAHYYYNGRLTVTDFKTVKDLGTFTIKIQCRPYKYNISTISRYYTYNTTLVNIHDTTYKGLWRQTVTSNQTYDAEFLTEVLTYVQDPTLTPPSSVLSKADFNGDGRITQTDYDMCVNLSECVLLPVTLAYHSPIVFKLVKGNMSERLSFTKPGDTTVYTIKSEDTFFKSMNLLNQLFEVTLIAKDGTQTTYKCKTGELQIPNLYGDTETDYLGFKIQVVNRRSNYKIGDTMQYEGVTCTITDNTTIIDKKVSISITERSL